MRIRTLFRASAFLAFSSFCTSAFGADVSGGRLTLDQGDIVTIVGNTFAERMVKHPNLEVLLQRGHPSKELVVRNLGWSGDEVALQPRPLNFGSMDDHIHRTGADVIVACFGMNESFKGSSGLSEFRTNLGEWIDEHAAMDIDGHTPIIVLVSPIAHETLGDPLPDGRSHTHAIGRYRDVMREEALERGALFVDLLRPTKRAMALRDTPLTINGIHCNGDGYEVCAKAIVRQLGLPIVAGGKRPAGEDALAQAILKRNDLYFQRWRPVNTEYVYGRRHEPYGNHNFPGEMQDLDRLVGEGDITIHNIVKAQAVSQ